MIEDWVKCRFEDLLDYEQPTNYIVNSTEYDDSYETPVLTAGKSFIKGYTNEKDGIFDNLPTIIFDDFTTASQFVNFKFKVKSSAMKILVPTSDLINMKFVYYAMQVNKVRSDTHKRYWISIYSKKEIFIPSVNEQLAIVAKIEELLSDLDKGIADLKKSQQQLKVHRQAVLKKAFKELVNKGWEESLLGDISSKITKGSTPTTYGFKYQNEGINFIKIENVIDGKIDKKSIYQFISEEAHENQKRSQLLDGDVLFSIAGTIGETCLITKDLLPANTNQAFAIISGFNQVLDANFLRKQLDSFMSRKLKDKARGGAMNNVSLTDLKNLKVVIPEMEIQHQVVKEIESRLSVCDKVEKSISESLEKAEALRQSILKKAFEGNLLSAQEIEKCKTAPDYEPAAVLLEKIKNL
jgi:type I restriction enzyme S subunit